MFIHCIISYKIFSSTVSPLQPLRTGTVSSYDSVSKMGMIKQCNPTEPELPFHIKAYVLQLQLIIEIVNLILNVYCVC